ncbi:DUF4013 domain-containing protein [Halorussus marinus]|uniref:DUF4013 domain-containing protein n=1 Tax=Halorussus marinus TaxID=2505976 RepID=UPI001431F990|nr:DUF4013 domain-containing protein [Halorussus marinus]
MFREALTYPGRADEETLLAGAALAVAAGLFARLGALAVLAVPAVVLLAGYALAVIRTTAQGAAEPPAFADLRTLARDGARALAVAVGYLLVPGLALGVTLDGAAAAGRPETPATSVFVFGAGTALLFVSAGLAYLLPAALAATAERRSLRGALDSSALRTGATDGGYFVAWTFALILLAVGGTAGFALAGLGRVGELVGLAVGAYALVAVARLAGLGARAAGGVDRR